MPRRGALRPGCPRRACARARPVPVSAEAAERADMADGGAERADGRIVKMEVDYSATVDQRLPECERLAQVRRERSLAGWTG